MAKKTNSEINNNKYFRIRAKIGVSVDGKSIMKNFYGSSKKDAETKRDEYLHAINLGLNANFDKLEFDKFFQEWFEEVKKPTISQNSYIRYEATYRLHIKPSNISRMKLLDVKSIHIQKLINNLPTPNTADRVKLLLSSFFNYCIEQQYMVISPLVSVKLPKIIKEGKKEFLERDEIQKLSSLDFENFIFIFAAFTGMRQGEILALTHADIDFKKELIRVEKSVKRVTFIENEDRKTKTLLKEPKTKSGIREIPIMKELITPLKKQISKEKSKHLKLGVSYDKNAALLFSTNRLTYKRGDHVLEDWKKVQKNLYDDVVTFHALRHTFCTMLCDQGVPLTVAAKLMGHSSIETVSRIYAHFMKDSLRESINSLSNYHAK